MSKVKEQKLVYNLKKTSEPIGDRIAKAVCERKKISERIFGYIPYEIIFVRAVYSGKTLRPAKITALEKGIVGILLVDGFSSFEKIGLILGLDVVHDKAEQSILRSAIETLRKFNAIEGDDSILALTDCGRAYADKGERQDSYTKEFEVFIDKSHPYWRNIKNCIGDNTKSIKEINSPIEDLNLNIEEIKAYAEQQAQDVHFPQNRYLLEDAIWVDGHDASYQVYVCFVQSVANSEDVRAFVYDNNSESLNEMIAEQINKDEDLKFELLNNCIRFECENDEETTALEDNAVDAAKAEIAEDLRFAELQIIKEASEKDINSTNGDIPIERIDSATANTDKIVVASTKDKLHKKALYDTMSFELELKKMFTEDDPDEIWLISPWIRKGAFLQDRGPMIEFFLRDDSKRVFIAYSEPTQDNEGKPMVDEAVEPGLKSLEDLYPNFFQVQLPEFHLKNVLEVKSGQVVLFSGSFNVLSFSVSGRQEHIRKEEMTLAHHAVARSKYADLQLEFAKVYAPKIKKEIETLDMTAIAHYKNERLDYFTSINTPDVQKLFSPIEDFLEERVLECNKANINEKLVKIGKVLNVASNMGGLNVKDRKTYSNELDCISRELSSNLIDDPYTKDLLENNLRLLESIPDKKIFPGKKKNSCELNRKDTSITATAIGSTISKDAQAVINCPAPISKRELYTHLLALFYCSVNRAIRANALIHTYLKKYIVSCCDIYDGFMIESSLSKEGAYDITIIVDAYSFRFRNLIFSDSLKEKWYSYVKRYSIGRPLTYVTIKNIENLLTKNRS